MPSVAFPEPTSRPCLIAITAAGEAVTRGINEDRVMPIQPTDRNAFLAELSTADYELFRPHLTSFSLTAGERLQDPSARFGC